MKKHTPIIMLLFAIMIATAGYLNHINNETKCPLEMKTPMGHEMEYIKHIDEFMYEYRDTHTGIHYIVDVYKGKGTIHRPIYRNEELDMVITK